MGDLEGLFVADEESVAQAIGHKVYFGEVLGKHSEIYGTLERDSLSIVSDDQEKINWLVLTMGVRTISGLNPLHYIKVDCPNCDWPICEDGNWYPYKEINGKMYCECYDEETHECDHSEEE